MRTRMVYVTITVIFISDNCVAYIYSSYVRFNIAVWVNLSERIVVTQWLLTSPCR